MGRINYHQSNQMNGYLWFKSNETVMQQNIKLNFIHESMQANLNLLEKNCLLRIESEQSRTLTEAHQLM